MCLNPITCKALSAGSWRSWFKKKERKEKKENNKKLPRLSFQRSKGIRAFIPFGNQTKLWMYRIKRVPMKNSQKSAWRRCLKQMARSRASICKINLNLNETEWVSDTEPFLHQHNSRLNFFSLLQTICSDGSFFFHLWIYFRKSWQETAKELLHCVPFKGRRFSRKKLQSRAGK